MDSPFGTALGWLLAGVFLGWLGNWLFDRLYRRDGPAAGELSALRLEALTGEIDSLRAELGELRDSLPALRAAPVAAPATGSSQAAESPRAPLPTEPDPAALSPMEMLARRSTIAAQPLWSAEEDREARARLEALRDYQTPGAAPASTA